MKHRLAHDLHAAEAPARRRSVNSVNSVTDEEGRLILNLPIGSRIILSCGTVIEGRPHDTEEYRATARKLGYGDDTLSMCRDHDPLHAGLCEWLGFGDSFALRCAAGLRDEDEISAAEESAVLAVQRFRRIALGNVPQGTVKTP